MRTALLSAVAALVLTSTYPVSSFAQHDDDDAHIDIRCPQNESLQNCVQAASQLIDKVHSLTPDPSEGRQGPMPSPGSH
jgi:hypothetical protein